MKIIGITVGTPMPRTNFEQTDPKRADYLKGREALIAQLEQAMKDIADLKYEAIAIAYFSSSVTTAEIGSTVDALTLACKLNKAPTSLTLDGEEKAVENTATYQWALSDLGLTADKTWTVIATDEREATAKKTASLKFLNGVYYGVLEDGTTLDSAAILTLTKKLQSSKALTFKVDAGSTQRICFAAPASDDSVLFNIGGFDYEWEKTTIEFTNASGYTESYDVWLSGQTGLGSTSTTVKIS